ncbi:hypothetical protein PInf_004575 [Phytophthora infestans]|nr:hypothetical protein PInf_004575 [Phytophthora infestans]
MIRILNAPACPKISPFFIPPVDLDVKEERGEIEDTSCTVRQGVYDQETRLIAQYLSADNRYARQLFWAATEIWHGFEHPNVAKIVGESMLLSQPCVVWEDAAAHGNFIRFFASERGCNQRKLWRMFLQVGHGLSHIHQRGGTHGSLKCSHILVDESGTPKICHFELINAAVGSVDRWKGPEYNLGKGEDPSKPEMSTRSACVLLKRARRFVAHDPRDRPTMALAIEMIEELAWKESFEEKKWREEDQILGHQSK